MEHLGSWAWGKFSVEENQIIFDEGNTGGLKCPKCALKSKQRIDTLKKHIRRNHPEVVLLPPTIRIKCSLCGSFQGSSHLPRHKKTCGGRVENYDQVFMT